MIHASSVTNPSQSGDNIHISRFVARIHAHDQSECKNTETLFVYQMITLAEQSLIASFRYQKTGATRLQFMVLPRGLEPLFSP